MSPEPAAADGGLSGTTAPTRRELLVGATAFTAASTFPAPFVSAAGPVQIKLMSWEQFQPGEKDGWNDLMQKFNASQSKVEVVWTGWPFNLFVQNVVTQAHAGGIEADVLMAPPDLAAQLVRKFDMAAPLDPIVDALGIHPSAGHNFLRKDGKLYGLSTIDMRFGLVYNKILFEQAGLSGPPQTPEEWVAASAKLTKRPDQFGLYVPNTSEQTEWWWSTMQNFVLPFDGTWADGKKPLVTSQPVIKGLQLWKDLYEAGLPKGTSGAAYLKLAAAERVAQTFDVIAFMIVLKSLSEKAYADSASAPPPWANRKALDRLHPLMVLNTSKTIDGAMDFVKFVMQPDNMATLMQKNLYIIPPYDDLAEKSASFKAYSSTMPWAQGFLSADPVSPVDIMGDFAYVDDQFGRIVVQNLQRTLNSGTSVGEAMASAQSQLEALATRI